MRHVLLFGLSCGLFVGALIPIRPAQGGCSNTSIAHSDDFTCCECGNEDNAVDTISVATGSEYVCILATEIGDGNVEAFTYAGWQCASVNAGTPVDFTVLAERTNHNSISQWTTETYVGGQCNNHLDHDTDQFDPCGG